MRRVAFVLACLLVGRIASADGPRVEVSGGYSYFADQLKDPMLTRQHNGGYVDGDFGWEVDRGPFPMVFSLGVSASGYFDTRDRFVDESPTLHPKELFQTGVGLFSAEGRFAIPFRIGGGDHGWFFMPRIGAGILADDYSIDTYNRNGAFHIQRTRDHEGVAFGVRPTLEAGYRFDWGAVGLQTSYMAGWGDFGQLGSMVQEFRAGVFVRFQMR